MKDADISNYSGPDVVINYKKWKCGLFILNCNRDILTPQGYFLLLNYYAPL
jgi:hypothetical protein